MTNSWLVRYGEIALKGGNRPHFEKLLVRNIKECLKRNNIAFSEVIRIRGRIIVMSENNCEVLKNVFGITSISPATKTELGRMEETAFKYYTKGTFRITAQRITKENIENSQDINIRIGSHIVGKTGAKVRLKNPDVNIGIEIINGHAYTFNKRIKAAGGLPTGSEGKVAVILEDEKSVKAAYLMMRRGCNITLIEKKKINYQELKKYAYGAGIKVAKEIPKDVKAIVTSETFNTLKNKKYKQIVIRPFL
ncbi:MAG: THUMP domain-containing protein [archaeon]